MTRLLTFLLVVGTAFAARPTINSFSTSATTVTSGGSVTLTWNITGSTTCTINDWKNNAVVADCTSPGSQSVTPSITTCFMPVAQNTTDGMGVAANLAYTTQVVCVFVGTNTLSLTTSASTTVSKWFEMTVINTAAGCGSFPASACTGLSANHNPDEDMLGRITFTGPSAETFSNDLTYVGGNFGLSGNNGNMWWFHGRNFDQPGTWTYAWTVGTGTDFKSGTGSFTVVTDPDWDGPAVVTGSVWPAYKSAFTNRALWPVTIDAREFYGLRGGNGTTQLDNGSATATGVAFDSGAQQNADVNAAFARMKAEGLTTVSYGETKFTGNGFLYNGVRQAGPQTGPAGTNIYPSNASNGREQLMVVAMAAAQAGLHFAATDMNDNCNSGDYLPSNCAMNGAGSLNQIFAYMKYCHWFMSYFGPFVDMVFVNYRDSGATPDASFFNTAPDFFRMYGPYVRVIGTFNTPNGGNSHLDMETSERYISAAAFPSSLNIDVGPITVAQPRVEQMVEGGNACSGAASNNQTGSSEHPNNDRHVILMWSYWLAEYQWGITPLGLGGYGTYCANSNSSLSNDYLGSQEFPLLMHFKGFTWDFGNGTPSVIVPSAHANCTGKSITYYVGGDTRDVAIFAINQTDRNSCSGSTVTFTMPAAMSGVWIDPQTGAQLGTFSASSGSQVISPPAFTTAILGRLRSTALGPLLKQTTMPWVLIGTTCPATTLAAQGGTPPYTYAITRGNVPPGCAFNTSSGAVTGIPTTAGDWEVGITATDSLGAASPEQRFYVRVFPALSAVFSSLPISGAPPGSGLAIGAMIDGGLPPIAISQSSVPLGYAASGTYGGMTNPGTLTQGQASITATATDGSGAMVTQTEQVNVGPTGLDVFLPVAATKNIAYQQKMPTLASSGTITTSSSGLPTGLSFAVSGTLITLSGTPTGSPGLYNATLQVTDSIKGAAQNALFPIVLADAPAITTTTLSTVTTNTPFVQSINTTGGAAPWACQILNTTALPAGVLLEPVSCTLYGVVASAGTTTFSVRYSDGNFASATQSLSLVAAAPSNGGAQLTGGAKGTGGAVFK